MRLRNPRLSCARSATRHLRGDRYRLTSLATAAAQISGAYFNHEPIAQSFRNIGPHHRKTACISPERELWLSRLAELHTESDE